MRLERLSLVTLRKENAGIVSRMDGEAKERLYVTARFSLISIRSSGSRDLIVRSDARTKLESGVIAGRLHATERI